MIKCYKSNKKNCDFIMCYVTKNLYFYSNGFIDIDNYTRGDSLLGQWCCVSWVTSWRLAVGQGKNT